MKMKIRDFQERTKVNQPLLVVNVIKGVANNGAPYMSLNLQDNSGNIEAKLWDVSEEISNKLRAGHIIEVVGDVIKYKSNLQLKLQSVEILNQKSYQLSDFIITSDISKEELKKGIYHYIDLINDEILKKVTKTIIDLVEKQFFLYPAASKNHHEFVGGLATHTLEMCQLAEKLGQQYSVIDMDYLYAGVLLHDVSKIDEFISPVVVEYSRAGKLLGHISMGQTKVYETAKELGYEDSEQVLLLRHMILSHHGVYEFGSPVRPLTLEAEMLNFIDNISARVHMFTKNTETLDEGQFSQRVFSLEGRAIYKPHKKDES